MEYSTLEILFKDASALEQLGTKPKFWFFHEEKKVLFKEGRKGTGENWAEVVTSRICDLLHIPHAHYDFAICSTIGKQPIEGVVCESFVPENARLVHANEMFAKYYQAKNENTYIDRTYTAQRSIALLEMLQKNKSNKLQINPNWQNLPKDVKTPIDVFVAYIMLDALIANQDRHYENWGFIQDGQLMTLTPSYDHASSLGRHESDEKRKLILETKDTRRTLEAYVQRGRSCFADSDDTTKFVKNIDAFKVFAQKYPLAASAWLSKLSLLNDSSLHEIFDKIPEPFISIHAKEFAIKLILLNKQRLLN